MFGEAVVFFNPEVAKEVQYIRKQLMQLHSKTRFIAAQFSAVLKHDLWLKTAGHANRMARMLANEAAKIPGTASLKRCKAMKYSLSSPAIK